MPSLHHRGAECRQGRSESALCVLEWQQLLSRPWNSIVRLGLLFKFSELVCGPGQAGQMAVPKLLVMTPASSVCLLVHQPCSGPSVWSWLSFSTQVLAGMNVYPSEFENIKEEYGVRGYPTICYFE